MSIKCRFQIILYQDVFIRCQIFAKLSLLRRVKMASTFGLQIDESTDVAGLVVLLVFVWYNYESRIEEDLLICKPLESYTMGEAIFNVIDSLIYGEK